LRQRLPDWSRRPALQVDLLLELVQLEVVLQLRVLPEEEGVADPAASSSQVVADPAQQAAALRQPDSYHRLPAALVPEAELARAKPTRTRLQRDR
jgi:hypothetical protein